MDAFALHDGAAAVYRLISATNEYIAQTRALDAGQAARHRRRACGQVLFDVAEAVRVAGVLLAADHPGIGS